MVDRAIEDPLTDEQCREACNIASNKLLSMGYTNAFDAYINHFSESGLTKTLKDMDNKGDLNVNIGTCYNVKSYDVDQYKEKVDHIANLNKQYKSKHHNPGYIKLFADGIVESGTGWMLEKYKNSAPGKEYGNQIWLQNELNDIVKYANSKDILIHTHTYGDAACRSALDAYVESNKENGKEYRNTLGHVRNIQFGDVKRATENKIAIAENLMWHTGFNDLIPEEKMQKGQILSHITEDLYESGYPMKSLIDAGAIVSSSTDAPVVVRFEGNIINIIEVATTGHEPNSNESAFTPSELLTVKEALNALTINGAWQLGIEKERGSIKVGKYADFVVLDSNILNYTGKDLDKIWDTKILNTYFEGKNVYESR